MRRKITFADFSNILMPIAQFVEVEDRLLRAGVNLGKAALDRILPRGGIVSGEGDMYAELPIVIMTCPPHPAENRPGHPRGMLTQRLRYFQKLNHSPASRLQISPQHLTGMQLSLRESKTASRAVPLLPLRLSNA
ncbi:hypothetical protein Pan189_12390 [Stratiformator vulcanicus]|uniref:Uncharacterized protein n=1 Tax=Stratiformator vulcanicus TaxID=2527980 RepID=A0A517QYZ2_9PLAN|nr:hypothetical protein Pan189_12390 [Stratiformator vulcanicus]